MTTTTNGTYRGFWSNDNTAFYIADTETFISNIHSMVKAFTTFYKRFNVAYSFKTNYLRKFCQIVRDENCLAEVVSPYEYLYARYRGFDNESIVYNGVIRDDETKFLVAREGGYVNVDNLNEYSWLAAMAAYRKKPISIGVRVNFDVGNGLCSRFGFDIDGDDFKVMMADMQANEYVNFRGFHCHIGTSRQLVYWKRKVETMIRLAKEYGASYIDLGGGMFGRMPEKLAEQFTDYTGDPEAYAEVVGKAMKEAFPDEKVRLIVEPGTALVGNTMELEAHVVNIKNIRGQTFITLDCTSNHIGMLCECREITYRHIPIPKGNVEPVHVEGGIFAGCTCLEFDYIRKNVSGDFSVGDTVIFENVGAYSRSASRQFIVPRLPVVEKGTWNWLCEKDSCNAMFFSL